MITFYDTLKIIAFVSLRLAINCRRFQKLDKVSFCVFNPLSEEAKRITLLTNKSKEIKMWR